MKQTASRISVLVAVVLTVFAFIGLMPIWAQTPGATFTVNSTVDAADANPGDGVCATEEGLCTLRAAIQETNALPGADTIEAPAGTYLLTIPGKFENESATGDLDVVDDLTIIGAGRDETIIDGNYLDRVFDLRCPGGDPYPMVGAETGDCFGRSQGELQVVISGVTVQHGDAGAGDSVGGGIHTQTTYFTLTESRVSNNYAANGGGVYQYDGIVTIMNSELSNNDASTAGGGIYTYPGLDSILQIIHSEIITNSGANGGGIYNTAALTISHTTLSNNTASLSGGGISNQPDGMILVSYSTFYGNSAAINAGGFSNFGGIVTINNSTLSGNLVDYAGGAIRNINGIFIVNSSTLSNNLANTDGGSIYNTGAFTLTKSILSNSSGHLGGGIYNSNTFMANHSTISDNSGYFGGGIFNLNTFTVNRSMISDNSGRFGGGIYNSNLGTTTVNNSTISDNLSEDGGGIWISSGTVTVNDSSLSSNIADGDGGGIFKYSSGTVTVNNSTIFDNMTGGSGGGIYNYANATTMINHSIFPGNSANYEGGIYDPQGSVTVNNSIIASNGGSDCAGSPDVFISLGYNLDSDGSCNLTGPGDLPNTDPLLDQLKDNGGGTLTHALLPGSPAIDAGDNDNCPATDQRGVARPKGAGCDIGAYERETIVLQLDYQYGANDGSMGTGRYTLLADNTFVDEQNGSGIWQYQPTPSPRLVLQYNPEFACNALSIGNFTGPGQVQGWRLCRDGSGVIGLWTGTVVTGAIDRLPTQ